MFCPPDYLPIAELWKQFILKHRTGLSTIARERYCAQSDLLPDEFGSPLDFIEDVFLRLISETGIFASTEDGLLARLETVLDNGRSRLFSKLSVLESALVAQNAQEAGRDNLSYPPKIGQ